MSDHKSGCRSLGSDNAWTFLLFFVAHIFSLLCIDSVTDCRSTTGGYAETGLSLKRPDKTVETGLSLKRPDKTVETGLKLERPD